MDDVFGEKNWFKKGIESIRISSALSDWTIGPERPSEVIWEKQEINAL